MGKDSHLESVVEGTAVLWVLTRFCHFSASKVSICFIIQVLSAHCCSERAWEQEKWLNSETCPSPFPPLPSFMYPHPPFPQVTKHFTWTQVSAFVPDGKKREDERLKGSHLGGECGLFGFRIIKQEDEKMWRSRKNAYAVEAAAPEVGPDLSLAENELDNAAFVSWSKGEIPTQIGGVSQVNSIQPPTFTDKQAAPLWLSPCNRWRKASAALHLFTCSWSVIKMPPTSCFVRYCCQIMVDEENHFLNGSTPHTLQM